MKKRSSAILALSLLASLGTLAWTRTSHAQSAEADEEDDSWKSRRPRLRDGLTLGMSLGAGAAGVSGFPNDPKYLNDPSQYSSSNMLFGSSIQPMLMGALSDTFNFGFFVNLGSYKSERWESNGGSVGFRAEAFPLVSRTRSKLSNLGLFAQFGVGFSSLHAKANIYRDAEVVQSYIGTGAFYEWNVVQFKASHIAMGPELRYDAIFSRDYQSHAGVLALRAVFYGAK